MPQKRDNKLRKEIIGEIKKLSKRYGFANFKWALNSYIAAVRDYERAQKVAAAAKKEAAEARKKLSGIL